MTTLASRSSSEIPFLSAVEAGTQFGEIAQDVERVLPELVRTHADGYLVVDYARLVARPVEAAWA